MNESKYYDGKDVSYGNILGVSSLFTSMVHKELSRRHLLMATAGTVGMGALSGCSALLNGEEEATDADVDANLEDLPEVSITYGHAGPPDGSTREHRAALGFKEFMETQTDGRFEVNIAPVGEIGTTTEMAEQTFEGSTEMVTLTGAHLGPFYPNMNTYAGAYTFPDEDLALFVMDGEWGDQLRADFRERTDGRIIGWYDTGGFQSFTSAGQPLESVSDLEGLTIRTMQMESHQELVRLVGAEPDPIDWTQTYEALDQGVADGQKNSIETIIMGSIEEVQDYMILDQHQLSMIWLFCNNAWYEDLHPTYQYLVDHAATVASHNGRMMNRMFRRYGVGYLEESGMQVHDPSPEEIEEFRETTQNPLDEFIREVADNPEFVDDLESAIDTAIEEKGYDRFPDVNN